MNRHAHFAAVLALGFVSGLAGCESLLEATFDTAMAVDRMASYTHEDVLVAEERPDVVGERLVTTVRVKGEFGGVARDRDARALGEIIIRGDDWGYTLKDRKAALDWCIRACERMHADLGPDESGDIGEDAQEMVGITLGAVDRTHDEQMKTYFRGRLSTLEPGPVRDYFENGTPNRWFFAEGLWDG